MMFSCLWSCPGGEVNKNCGVQREVPDSQHSTPPNKSKHNSKDSWWLSIKPIPSCLRLSAVTLFPWFLRAGVSLSMFLDKQIRFLLKQAAAVPFDNNVIIQNKWFSSLMRENFYGWRRLTLTLTSVWFYLLELYPLLENLLALTGAVC